MRMSYVANQPGSPAVPHCVLMPARAVTQLLAACFANKIASFISFLGGHFYIPWKILQTDGNKISQQKLSVVCVRQEKSCIFFRQNKYE